MENLASPGLNGYLMNFYLCYLSVFLLRSILEAMTV